MKAKSNTGASVRELKAAELDRVVKAELAKKRAADAVKISNLKALRLARDAEQEQLEASAPKQPPSRSAPVRKMRRPPGN